MTDPENPLKMNAYLVHCEVKASGIQIYYVEANSGEEATKKVDQGEGEFVWEDITPDTCVAMDAELKEPEVRPIVDPENPFIDKTNDWLEKEIETEERALLNLDSFKFASLQRIEAYRAELQLRKALKD